jgi:hypothetical protein
VSRRIYTLKDYRRDLSELDARTRATALRMLLDALPHPAGLSEAAPSSEPVSGVVQRSAPDVATARAMTAEFDCTDEPPTRVAVPRASFIRRTTLQGMPAAVPSCATASDACRVAAGLGPRPSGRNR